LKTGRENQNFQDDVRLISSNYLNFTMNFRFVLIWQSHSSEKK